MSEKAKIDPVIVEAHRRYPEVAGSVTNTRLVERAAFIAGAQYAALPPLRAGDREEIARAVYVEFYGSDANENSAAFSKALNVAAAILSRPVVQGEWRDISTAPKDGTPVLLAGGTLESLVHDRSSINDKCIRSSWHEYRFCSDPQFQSIWLVDCTDDGEVQVCNPSHWMPLPAPPVAEPKAG